MSRATLTAGAFAAMLFAGSGAWAAGGHHAVDDAAILEPGACELEGWFARSRGGERSLHLGTGCRVGPVELGVAAEHARQSDDSATGYGIQAKWAREWAPGFSAGVSVSSGWQSHVRPHYQGTTVSALATWAAREDLALHLNIGRDFVHRDRNLNRSGAAVEWTPRAGWSLMIERYLEEQTHFVRAGLRRPAPGGVGRLDGGREPRAAAARAGRVELDAGRDLPVQPLVHP